MNPRDIAGKQEEEDNSCWQLTANAQNSSHELIVTATIKFDKINNTRKANTQMAHIHHT